MLIMLVAWIHSECSGRLGLRQVLETYAMFVATQLAQSTLVTRAIRQKRIQNGQCVRVLDRFGSIALVYWLGMSLWQGLFEGTVHICLRRWFLTVLTV